MHSSTLASTYQKTCQPGDLLGEWSASCVATVLFDSSRQGLPMRKGPGIQPSGGLCARIGHR